MKHTLTTLTLAASLLLGACAATATTTTDEGSEEPMPTEPEATGTIAVQLEKLDGVLIEAFEAGLRFETLDGTTIAAVLWSDFVAAQGNPTLEDFYDSVLEQTVPAGQVVVLASLNVGIGPAPEVPDINGDLRCKLVVDVPADGQVDVQLSFDGSENCLSKVG